MRCERCSHDADGHFVVATGDTPAEGGVIICQDKGCLCFATWAVPQLGSERETIRIPDDEELAGMREALQK